MVNNVGEEKEGGKSKGRMHTEAMPLYLTTADEETIEVAATGGNSRTIRYDDILWAKVQLPW